jgi:hypothetical protein
VTPPRTTDGGQVITHYQAAECARDREFAEAVELMVNTLTQALCRWRRNATGSVGSTALLTAAEAIDRYLVLAVPGPVDTFDYRPTPREFADLIYALVALGTEIIRLSIKAGAALDRPVATTDDG